MEHKNSRLVRWWRAGRRRGRDTRAACPWCGRRSLRHCCPSCTRHEWCRDRCAQTQTPSSQSHFANTRWQTTEWEKEETRTKIKKKKKKKWNEIQISRCEQCQQNKKHPSKTKSAPPSTRKRWKCPSLLVCVWRNFENVEWFPENNLFRDHSQQRLFASYRATAREPMRSSTFWLRGLLFWGSLFSSLAFVACVCGIACSRRHELHLVS